MNEMLIWDGASDLSLPTGRVICPEEVLREFPMTEGAPVVIEMSGEGVVYAIDNLLTLCEIYGIEPGEDNEEVIALIQKERQRIADIVPEPGVQELMDILLGVSEDE